MSKGLGDEPDASTADDVFASYIDRLLAGEVIDLDEVQSRHPELDETVLEQLRSFCDLADDASQAEVPHRLGDFEIIREIGRRCPTTLAAKAVGVKVTSIPTGRSTLQTSSCSPTTLAKPPEPQRQCPSQAVCS